LRHVPVSDDTVADWCSIHNEVIPTDPLTLAQCAERADRYHLTLGYRDDVLVGNATVRPPQTTGGAAVVIVRILPPHRRQGLGSSYLVSALAEARSLGGLTIETVVLSSNEDGLRFAVRHGFVEFNLCTLDGAVIPYVELRLMMSVSSMRAAIR
jgi:GNAT superfamily N-acetyltransferase